MVQREYKRARTVKKYSNKRAELKAIIKSASASYEEREAASLELQKQPRNLSLIHI